MALLRARGPTAPFATPAVRSCAGRVPATSLSSASVVSHAERAEQLLTSGAATAWRRDLLEDRLELLRADAALVDDFAVELDSATGVGWRVPIAEVRALPRPGELLVGEQGDWTVVAPEDGGRLIVTGLPSLGQSSGTPGSAR